MIKPIKDYVIVKPQSTERKSSSGLIIVTDYDPSTHVPVIGEVKILPIKKSECDLQVGDIVFMDRFACLMAWGREFSQESITNDNAIIFIDGIKHFYMNYKNIYMAIRGDKKIMLNDYILVTAVKMIEKSDLVIDKEYYSDLIFRCEIGNDEIKEGEYLIIEKGASKKKNTSYQFYVKPVENHNYRTLEKEYYVVKSDNVMGILTDIETI